MFIIAQSTDYRLTHTLTYTTVYKLPGSRVLTYGGNKASLTDWTNCVYLLVCVCILTSGVRYNRFILINPPKQGQGR